MTMKRVPKAVFQHYKEENEDCIGPAGFETLAQDIGLSMDGIEPLLLSWFFKCSRMGFISWAEWEAGIAASGLKTASAKDLGKQVEALRSAMQDKAQFKRFYCWLFGFSKAASSKTLDVEIAEGLLSVIFNPAAPHIEPFVLFLKTQKQIIALNKDQWQSLLDFSNTIELDFSNYHCESAWPVLFDSYVEHALSQKK